MTTRLDDIHRLFTKQARWSAENSFTVSVADEIIISLRERIIRKEVVGTICDLRDMMSMTALEKIVSTPENVIRFPALKKYIARLKLRGDDREVEFQKTSMHIHSNMFSEFYSVLSSMDDFDSIVI